jgi:Ras-related protein Rab-1A
MKMAIVGGCCAGKSQLMLRFTDDSYTNDYTSTNFVDFKLHSVEVDGAGCELQIWDVGGSPLASAFCRRVNGIVFA